MKQLLVALTVLLALSCSRDRAKQPPAPEPVGPSLAQRVADGIRARAPKLRVEIVNDLEVRVFTSDGDSKGSTTYLTNLARICEQGETECDEGVERFVSTAVKMGDELGETKPIDPNNVLATLKDSEYVRQLQELMAEKGPRDAGPPSELVARRFVGELWIVYVEDSADSMRMVMSKDLDELKLDADELHALALANMRKAFPKIPYQAVEEVPHMWAVTAGDSYDAARMLLHEQWKEIAADVDGDLILAVPSRDLVAFTGTAFPDSVRDLRAIATQASQNEAYALTGELFKWTPGGWVVHPQ